MSIGRYRLACAGLAISLAIGLSQPAVAQRSLFDQAPPESPPVAAPTPEAPAAKPRPKPRRPSGPVPARALSVNNASSDTLTALEVSGEGKSARLTKPLAPKKKTTLKLPALKSCTVSVSASFEGQGQAAATELDICKDKVIRFTDG